MSGEPVDSMADCSSRQGGTLSPLDAQRGLNRTEVCFPGAKRLHRLFEQQVAMTPEAPALLCEEGVSSFAEVNRNANRLARHLRGCGVEPGTPVGLFLERSAAMVEGVLGILKAGGAYVPLTPDYPVERIQLTLADAGVPIVLTQGSLGESLPHEATTVLLDADRALIARHDGGDLAEDGPDVAYVMYTSGSAGRPKGVLGKHTGAVNRLQWMWRQYPYGPGEVGCQKTSLSFIDSLCEIFGPLLQGVPLAIVPGRGSGDPRGLVSVLAAQGVTRLVLVPSLLRALLDGYPDLSERLPRLRQCVSSGEVLPWPLAHRFRKCMPGCTLINLYGSTEVAGDATYFEVGEDSPGATVPIGRPIANMSVYILDSQGVPVHPGEIGELYVGGPGLAHGYLGQPERTAERFVTWSHGEGPGRLYRTGDLSRFLPDGNVEFLGRVDYQIKVRGIRTEPGEIEAVALQVPGVAQAVVVARDNEGGTGRLVLYAVPDEGRRLQLDALAAHLAASLPEYMVPSAIVPLERLPLNPNGKLDRAALPPPSARAPECCRDGAGGRGAWTPTERSLAALWERAVGVEHVDRDDDFFELGGDSLSSLVMLLEVERTYGVPIPNVFFQSPTISHLARLVSGERTESPAQAGPGGQTVSAEQTREERSAFLTARERLESVAFRLPYGWGIRWLRLCCGPPFAAFLYRHERRVVRQFLEAILGPGQDHRGLTRTAVVADVLHRHISETTGGAFVREEFARSLRASGLPFWREFARTAASPSVPSTSLQERYVLVGAEVLAPIRARGQGAILLNYHSPCFQLSTPAVYHLGFPEVCIGAMADVFRRQNASAFGARRSDSAGAAGVAAELAHDLYGTLKRGGLVMLAGDGRRGRVHTELPVCGRVYSMRSGFAELALRTGAAVVPTMAGLHLDGRIRLTFLDSLDTGAAEQTHSQRVSDLTQQYVRFLEGAWRSDPASLTIPRMELHLSRPITAGQVS